MSPTPRKGEIWQMDQGDDRMPMLVLIVSADEWQEGAPPQAVALVRRHGMDEIPPYIVALADTDNVANAVALMESLMPIDPNHLIRGMGSVGTVTLSKVDESLRQVFAL